MTIYAFGRGVLGHLTLKIEGNAAAPSCFDLVTNGEREHAQELYAVIAKRQRQEMERAIASAELKVAEVEI